MNNPFDHIASQYDREFSETQIGINQRTRVWAYLEGILKKVRSIDILELNCGTGLDALYLAGLGHNICATDSSKKMLEIASSRFNKHWAHNHLRWQLLDIKNPYDVELTGRYNMVFSNFGGLNCLNLSELYQLNDFISEKLKPGGHWILIIMPRYSIIETMYACYKRKWNRISTRAKGNNPWPVRIGNETVNCYYYNSGELKKIFHHFELCAQRVTGLLPTYFEHFISCRKILLWYFNRLEDLIYKSRRLSNYGDHCLLHFIKRDDVN